MKRARDPASKMESGIEWLLRRSEQAKQDM